MQSRRFPQLHPSGPHPVDPPIVLARPDINSLLDVFGNPFWMFDDQPIHIRDIDCAVRSRLDRSRTEPWIARSQKLPPLFARRSPRAKRNAIRLQHLPMHQVMRWFADKNTALKLRPE